MLYSLRDVTGTVPSLPLIISSVMCKKIAAGADEIVMGVEIGINPLMKSLEEGQKLAQMMVRLLN